MGFLSAQAEDSLKFPFNQNPEVTFLRYNSKTGVTFSMDQVNGQWEVKLKQKEPKKTTQTEKISNERANEILRAFSSLYSHWHGQPEMSSDSKSYSMCIWIKDNDWPWVTQIRVRDAGSEELKHLKELIGFTD